MRICTGCRKPETEGIRQGPKARSGQERQSKPYSEKEEDEPGEQSENGRKWSRGKEAGRAQGPSSQAEEGPNNQWATKEAPGNKTIQNQRIDLIEWLRTWVGSGLGKVVPGTPSRWRVAIWQRNSDTAELRFLRCALSAYVALLMVGINPNSVSINTKVCWTQRP